MKTKEEIFTLLNENPAFHLATVENGRPHVRGIFMYKADERGIIFHTGTFKDLYKQLQENPEVEMCFFNPQNGEQVRISGKVVLDRDKNLLDEIYNHPSRAFLRSWGNIEEKLAVYRMPHGKAVVWTMASNFEPKTYIEF